MAHIYKITNLINGKLYIGKTELDPPTKRWDEHRWSKNVIRQKNRPLYAALRKYGLENFKFEILEECDNPEEREMYYIEKYRTYVGFEDCNGYNATLGGDGKKYVCGKLDDEIIRIHTNEAGYCLGETVEITGHDRGTVIKVLKKHNVPWINHKDMKARCHYLKTGGIYQINPKTLEIENIFLTQAEVNELFDVKRNNKSLCRALKDHSLYNGWLWYYGEDIPLDLNNKLTYKGVQFDSSGNVIST